MKTRNGFVSNSSTSSFVLIGWEIPLTNAQDLQKLMLTLGQLCKDPLPELVFDENDHKGMAATEGNRAAFDLVGSYRWSNPDRQPGHFHPSVRLGLPCWGDCSSGVPNGSMLIGMEGDGFDMLDAWGKLTELMAFPPQVRIKVYGGTAEQAT